MFVWRDAVVYQWSFITWKMCIRKRNSYLIVIAEGNSVELYQLLLPNSVVVKIGLNPCQVFSNSHFSVQPSRHAGILITRSVIDIQIQ